MECLNIIAEHYKLPVIFSTHPRTRKKIEEGNYLFNDLIRFEEPFGFFDYLHLQKNAYIVLSDSGTISEESAMGCFNAISIRTSTERPEAIDAGTVILGGISHQNVLQAIEMMKKNEYDLTNRVLPIEYTIPNVSEKVARIILGYTSIINRVIWNR